MLQEVKTTLWTANLVVARTPSLSDPQLLVCLSVNWESLLQVLQEDDPATVVLAVTVQCQDMSAQTRTVMRRCIALLNGVLYTCRARGGCKEGQGAAGGSGSARSVRQCQWNKGGGTRQ